MTTAIMLVLISHEGMILQTWVGERSMLQVIIFNVAL
jgi:hypothetical protein